MECQASPEVKSHNQTVLDSLEEGDLVEFSRGVYSHWAVYIGNKKVIHLMTDRDKSALNPTHLSSCCGRCPEKASVCIDKFLDVAGKDKAKRNNSLDEKKRPLPRRQIVKNALSRLNEVGYTSSSKIASTSPPGVATGRPAVTRWSFVRRWHWGLLLLLVLSELQQLLWVAESPRSRHSDVM